ncbi:MFS transporter, partial [Pseudomonas neuropathica]|uniref:MFS transporter n=1 Tax=Pseudomonas neuropathica TaxID=2730425 RepID=UPI0034D4AFD0
IYPMKLRSLLISSVFAIKWAMAFIITRYFLTELLFFGSGNTFWFYAATSFLGFIFVYFFVPETKNKSLQDMKNFG